MEHKPVEVEILESAQDSVMVKLPFANIPVRMDLGFFRQRLEKGCLKVKGNPIDRFYCENKLHPVPQYLE